MMKRVYIVVEGQTEQEFVNSILRPYLSSQGIFSVTPILIHTSKSGRGGFVNYEHLSNTIKMLLDSRSLDLIVTTFVDFFRMPTNMPSYQESMNKLDRLEQVESFEFAVATAISDRRFMPYIQLHEFEALLFSCNNGFEYYFEATHHSATRLIIEQYPNPEEINTTPNGAPSKRLLAIKSDYDKVTEGNLIALEIGIDTFNQKCPRFSNWLSTLVTKCQD